MASQDVTSHAFRNQVDRSTAEIDVAIDGNSEIGSDRWQPTLIADAFRDERSTMQVISARPALATRAQHRQHPPRRAALRPNVPAEHKLLARMRLTRRDRPHRSLIAIACPLFTA